ncbi:MAG: SPOR domain-containing protein [Phycisphaerae bacterium]|nr:SPOR domain-containing protein [Phycisphaerae bacterium]
MSPSPSLRCCRLALVVASLAVAPLVGCATGDARAQLDRSVAAYDKDDFATARKEAESAAESAKNTKDADDAAYMAGMSAFRMGDYDDAVRWLTEASRSANAWTAGQAGVMLGNAQLKQSKPRDAAKSFAAAAQKLSGDDARKARIAAANAYKEAGDSRAADEQFRLANVPTTVVVDGGAGTSRPTPPASNPSPGAGAPAAPSGPYVLQAGAFRDRAKAQSRASELRVAAVRAGLGEPRVATKRGSDGATLYVVQMGGFPDRRSADGAAAKLGQSGVVVINASTAMTNAGS